MAIVVPIDADVSGLVRKLNGAGSALGGFGKMAMYVAGGAAMGGLVATMKIGVDEFMASSRVTAQTEAVLKSTGRAAGVTKKHVEELAGAIEQKSMIDDEAIQSGENLLLTFTKVRNEAGKGNDVFDQAVQVMADVSTAMGIDTSTAAIQLGKALNDPVRGVGQLRKVGVSFTEAQRDQIKALVESGHTLDAQKMILRELQTEFGGSAEAAGKTLPGQLAILKNTFNNLAGELVANFMPAIATAATKVSNFLIQLVQAPTLKARVEVITGAVDAVWERIKTWWTTGERKELPSGVKLTPPGSKQVEEFAQALKDSLDGKIKSVGNDLGYSFASALFGGTKQGAKDKGKSAGSDFVKMFVVNVPAIKLGIELATSIIDGIEKYMGEDGSKRGNGIFDKWAESILQQGLGPGYMIGKWVAEQFNEGASTKPKVKAASAGTILAKNLTDDVKAAIQSARSGLAGAASGLAGMLNQIVSANFRVGGTGRNAAESLTEQRNLEDRRFAIQKNALQAALDATEEGSDAQVQAKLELDQFYFDREQTLRQRGIDDEQRANQTKIDDLAARFNKGLISASDFASQLDGIIGAEKGTSLGEAFALSFSNALQSVKNAAADIFNIVGQGSPLGPDMAGGKGPATAAAQAAFDDAKAKWQDRFNKRRQTAIDARKKKGTDGDEKVTKAEWDEIAAIMQKWETDPANRRPQRADYGLAAGGIVTGPRFLVGEGRFNEAVIPLGSPTATQMMRQAFSDAVNGGGDTIINVEINAGLGTDPAELGREVVKAIKTFERKNGPVFVGA